MHRHATLLPFVLVAGCFSAHGPGGAPIDPDRDGGPPITGGDSGPGPIDPPPPRDGGPGACMLFLLGSWNLEEPFGSGADAYGFNLDGRVSTGVGSSCVDLSPDFRSIDTREPGVDNAYATLVPQISMLLEGGSIRDVLARQLEEGVLLYAIELCGVDDLVEDASVEVIVHRATAIDGLRAMGGVPEPDQRVALEPISRGRGAIHDRRLDAELGDFEMAFSATSELPLLPMVLHSPRVRGIVWPDGGGIQSAQLGGTTRVEDVAVAAERAMPGLGDTVRSVLQGIADMEPRAADPSTCDALSFAYTFWGVPARR